MIYKTLNLEHDLRERIVYESNTLPLVICEDKFDEYFQREWGCHWHEEFELCVVRQGCVVYTLYDGGDKVVSYELTPGDGLYIASGLLHSARALEAETIVDTVVFPLSFFDMPVFQRIFQQNIQPLLDAQVTHLHLQTQAAQDEELLSAIAALAGLKKDEPCYELHTIELVGRIWRLLILHIAEERQTPICLTHQLQAQRVKDVISYIHSHIREPLRVEDMAQAAGISRTECFRCFQLILQKTPAEYVTEYRISQAAAMLLNTSRTITDIAYAYGFATPSYFGKIFREHCGCTPKEYRKKGTEN